MKLGWSNLAKNELSQLRRFSTDLWGVIVAAKYLADVRDAAKAVAVDPRRARLLRGQFRIVRVRSHCLIVTVGAETDTLTIARILHAAMDIERHLPAPDS